jgi:hypothetical protein
MSAAEYRVSFEYIHSTSSLVYVLPLLYMSSLTDPGILRNLHPVIVQFPSRHSPFHFQVEFR